MEPKFTGPSFTIGIEEELMILDSETLALANAIEAVLEEHGEDEHVKPELLEPVLEIATAPHPDTRAAGEQLRALRTRGQRGGQAARPVHRLGRHAPVRDVGGPARRPRARATAS